MAAKTAKIVLLPGDGVGPEVVAEARKVLEVVAAKLGDKLTLEFTEELMGGCAIDATGVPLPPKTLNACRTSTAILLGAVGGPAWPKKSGLGAGQRPEVGLLQLRKELDLFANLRPCEFPAESLLKKSPLKEEVVRGVQFTVVRELTGGIYFGKRMEETEGVAWDTMEYSVPEVERIARIAGFLALQSTPPQTVTSIDKANVLASSRLWRRVVTELFAKEFPTVPLQHNLVDSAAMVMVMNPRKLNGVILTENMFGDILSDESSVIPGSLGLLPSASLSAWGEEGKPAMYEPIHGSAPDIAGQGIANPVGTILSVAMLLRYSLGLEREAKAVEAAVAKVLDDTSLGGLEMRTKDLGGAATTKEIGAAVVKALEAELAK